jgi:hypothetical protein
MQGGREGHDFGEFQRERLGGEMTLSRFADMPQDTCKAGAYHYQEVAKKNEGAPAAATASDSLPAVPAATQPDAVTVTPPEEIQDAVNQEDSAVDSEDKPSVRGSSV